MKARTFSAAAVLMCALLAVRKANGEDAVVVIRNVQVKSDGKVVDELFPGAALDVIARDGERLQFQTLKSGWIDRSAVVPMTAAADYFTAAMARSPGQAELYRARAMVFRHRKQLDRAISDFDEAVRLDPRNALAFAGRGVAWKQKGDLVRAIADLDEALRIDPSLEPGYLVRGQLWLFKDDDSRAMRDFSRAVQLAPQDPQPYFLRAVLRFDDDPDGAIADCGQAIRLGLQDMQAYGPKAYEVRGSLLYKQGKFIPAIADFDRALHLNPSNAQMLRQRGNAWRCAGDQDKAIADFGQAILLDPRDADAYYWRARACEAQGDLKRALEDVEAALRIDKSDLPTLHLRDSLQRRLQTAPAGGGE